MCELKVWIAYQILYSSFWNLRSAILVKYGLKTTRLFSPWFAVTEHSVCNVGFAADTCYVTCADTGIFVAFDGLKFCFCCGFLRNTNFSVTCRTSEIIPQFSDFQNKKWVAKNSMNDDVMSTHQEVLQARRYENILERCLLYNFTLSTED